ncbi:MAG TPA: ribbon-helix-helix protein, CopG family [Alphaproteobacteria bacterium]|jgi:metal-responsive CopG/Arc/MetJ family transcriptional regulator
MANGKQTHVVAVSLPKELFRDLEKLRARLFRKRSEVVKEAVRQYVERYRHAKDEAYWAAREAAVPYDDEPYTAADRAAVRRAQAEYRRGEYLTLEELKRKLGHVARRRSAKR